MENLRGDTDDLRDEVNELRGSVNEVSGDMATYKSKIEDLESELGKQGEIVDASEGQQALTSKMDIQAAKPDESWVHRNLNLLLSLVSLGVAIATLVYTISQLAPLTKQADAAEMQAEAQQRASDWALASAITVSIAGNDVVIENRDSSAIMTTATWLIRGTETAGERSFDAIFFELEGVPGCSRVSIPIEVVTQNPESIPELPWDEPEAWDWPDFEDAYTYIIAPSGGLYSTSTRGGIVDHGVVGSIDQASPNYGERYKELNVDWEDPSTLAWVPDTFWEFDTVQVARAGAPIRAGAPLIGKDDKTAIQSIDCR